MNTITGNTVTVGDVTTECLTALRHDGRVPDKKQGAPTSAWKRRAQVWMSISGRAVERGNRIMAPQQMAAHLDSLPVAGGRWRCSSVRLSPIA